MKKYFKVLVFMILIASNAMAQKVKITTQLGEIVVQLEAEKAPITSANFTKYVEGNYYKGGSFYRTVTAGNQPDSPIKIEVIQAGCHPWMQNFLFDPILLERSSQTGITHENGTISMARDEPDTAQESFFICIGDQPELDFGGKRNPDGQGFAAFGRVVSGMEIVQKIHDSNAEGQALMLPIMILDMAVLH
jgi:peptidyl-prolyl cis-trans isomerase A (cyclophilin A)